MSKYVSTDNIETIVDLLLQNDKEIKTNADTQVSALKSDLYEANNNILDTSKSTLYSGDGLTVTQSEDTFTASGTVTSSSNKQFLKIILPDLTAGVYYVSTDQQVANDWYFHANLKTSSDATIGSGVYNGTVWAFTVDKEYSGAYLVIDISTGYEATWTNAHIWMNKGEAKEYEKYGESVPKVTKVANEVNTIKSKFVNRPAIILCFDAWTGNTDDERYALVKNAYGFNFTANCPRSATAYTSIAECVRKQKAEGIDFGYYNGNNCPIDTLGEEVATSDTPTVDTLKAWDVYVKDAIDTFSAYGVLNPVVWQCRFNKTCVGLEKALEKYKIPMLRGNNKTSGDYVSTEYNKQISPLGFYATQLDSTKNYIDEAIMKNGTICIFTHGFYPTEEEATTNYGTTKALYTELLEYIKEKVDAGLIDVITFAEYYAIHCPEKAISYNELREANNNLLLQEKLDKETVTTTTTITDEQHTAMMNTIFGEGNWLV